MDEEKISEGRRNFLKKSTYAAYSTPVILALLVDKADAMSSCGGGDDDHRYGPGHGKPPPPFIFNKK